VSGLDADALARPALRGLPTYDPGHDLVALRAAHAAALVELGANENPWGPSPRALEAARMALDAAARYPDPRGAALKRALAARTTHPVEGIALGNGSHELLMQLAQAFAGPDAGVVASRYGFAVYALAAIAAGAPLALAPALPDEHPSMPLGHDLDALLAAVTPATRLVYLANPNNPTGTWFDSAALEAFLAALPPTALCVLDEAYAEFVDAPGLVDHAPLLARFPRLVITRTFSKAHGLAGLRVGYALAHPAVVAVLERLRESFNVSAPALAAAEAALADDAHLARVVAATRASRDALAQALRAQGRRVLPSQGNFVLVRFGVRTAAIEAALVARGIVLRPMGGYGLGEWLRITCGTPEENAALLAALEAVDPRAPAAASGDAGGAA
jgi:histidinol-phosphate aminotransferase